MPGLLSYMLIIIVVIIIEVFIIIIFIFIIIIIIVTIFIFVIIQPLWISRSYLLTTLLKEKLFFKFWFNYIKKNYIMFISIHPGLKTREKI